MVDNVGIDEVVLGSILDMLILLHSYHYTIFLCGTFFLMNRNKEFFESLFMMDTWLFEFLANA